MEIGEIQERAEKARQLLDNPLFRESVETLRKAIFVRIEECPLRDAEGLQLLHIRLALLRDVEAALKQVIAEGKFTAFELEERQRLANTR